MRANSLTSRIYLNISSILSLFIYFTSIDALANDYPYEKCSWKNKQMTERMISESMNKSSSKTEAEALCIKCESKKTKENYSNASLTAHDIKMLHDTTFKTNDIPEICFLASSLRASSGTGFWSASQYGYYYCPKANTSNRQSFMRFDKKSKSLIEDDKNLKKQCGKKCLYPAAQRVCLSKNYIGMTAKAFNETANCFGYTSKKNKGQLFALMNHESAFLLNKKPKNNQSARCYGQIQNNAIIDTNAYIKFGNPHTKPFSKAYKKYYQIYKELMSKPECSFLESKRVQFPNFKYKKGKKFTREHAEINFIKEEDIGDNIGPVDQYKLYAMKKTPQGYAMKCKTSQDAYSCLFYTLFNTKKNEIDLQERLAQNQISEGYAKLVNISDKHKKIVKDFKAPIQLNEMLVVEGSIIKNGKKKNIGKLVIKSVDELLYIFDKDSIQYNIKDLKVKKIKVFDSNQNKNDDALKWAFMHLTHNGGSNISLVHFENFIHVLKSAISEDNKTNRPYRNRILSGKSLSIKQLTKAFKHYANTTKMVHKDQVTKFLTKMQNGIQALHSKKEMTKHINGKKNKPIIPGMKVVDSFKKDKKQKINNFAKQVNESCPKNVF